MKDPGKTIFDLFSFQYKPLEKHILKNLPEKYQKKYHKLTYSQKIQYLDRVASHLGL